MSAVLYVILAGVLVFAAASLFKCCYQVQEKQNIIIERFGKFSKVLKPGINMVVPWIDVPRSFTHRYFTTDNRGRVDINEKINKIRVSTQNEVLDFPKQPVISRDNAKVSLDAVLQFRITDPRKMLYTTQNLPHMLSRILMAQIRNVAGMMDVDQIIEDQASLTEITGSINNIATQWGVEVDSVKIQRVEAGELAEVLAKKKKADLRNKEIVINAKAQKQTQVIQAEGQRDSMVREAEGRAQQMLSRARGQAQATLNQANAEARSVIEIARALAKYGEDPAAYLLAMKYTDALKAIISSENTTIEYMPSKSTFLQISSKLGLNTVYPPSSR